MSAAGGLCPGGRTLCRNCASSEQDGTQHDRHRWEAQNLGRIQILERAELSVTLESAVTRLGSGSGGPGPEHYAMS